MTTEPESSPPATLRDVRRSLEALRAEVRDIERALRPAHAPAPPQRDVLAAERAERVILTRLAKPRLSPARCPREAHWHYTVRVVRGSCGEPSGARVQALERLVLAGRVQRDGAMVALAT